ncbi:MAG: hypothetical protein NT164_01840 [Verrucomicrobiae bacterium]|nr:hypothetical protein [Verrucomicrobiae bacterium]
MDKKSSIALFSQKDQEELSLPSLTIRTPTQEQIWISPIITLKRSDRKLLMAPSGTGKTSFLRAISGIYPYVDQSSYALPTGMMLIL